MDRRYQRLLEAARALASLEEHRVGLGIDGDDEIVEIIASVRDIDRGSLLPEYTKTIHTAEYTHLQTCKREFEKLTAWLLENLSHQIGMGDLVNGESAVDMVTRLLYDMASPGYLFHVAVAKGEDGAVVATGSLWDPKCGVATQGASIYEVLTRLGEVIQMYEDEITKRWGHEVLTGMWDKDTVAHRNQLTRASLDLEAFLLERGQEGLSGVDTSSTCIIVYLLRGTAEFEGPWHFGDRQFAVTVEFVEEDYENVEELTR